MTLNYRPVTPPTMGINPVERAIFPTLLNRNPHPIAERAVFRTPRASRRYFTFNLAIGFEPAVEEIPPYSPNGQF
tara:strand:+ start:3260 stop:3484 length:225 start_codon:yes stop_codon:yes gene_type:complete